MNNRTIDGGSSLASAEWSSLSSLRSNLLDSAEVTPFQKGTSQPFGAATVLVDELYEGCDVVMELDCQEVAFEDSIASSKMTGKKAKCFLKRLREPPCLNRENASITSKTLRTSLFNRSYWMTCLIGRCDASVWGSRSQAQTG